MISTLALRVGDAAAEREFLFRREVLPSVRSVKVGKARVFAVVELELALPQRPVWETTTIGRAMPDAS